MSPENNISNEAKNLLHDRESFSIMDTIRYKRLSYLYKSNYLNNQKLIFIHNPRTGGQSFAKLVYGRSLGHLTASDIKKTMGAKEYESRTSIGFTRCPVDRLKSAFRFSQSGGSELIKQNGFRRVPKWALENFDIFCREWLFQQKKDGLDFVFRSQYLWLFNKKQERIVNEIYDTSLIAVASYRHFGEKVELQKLNSSVHCEATQKNLSESLIKEIRDYYKKDCILLESLYKRRY